MYSVLIVDDENEVIDFLSMYLEKEGFSVTGTSDGASALSALSVKSYDCILLDVMLPQMNGFQMLKKLRETSQVPVIMISARVTAADKILGLDLGGDDYITKPFDPLEVVARVKSNIRRYRHTARNESIAAESSANAHIVKAGPYKLDLEKCQFKIEEKTVDITSTEFQLLKLFLTSPNRVFTKQQLMEAAWPEQNYVEDNSIMVALSKLRTKMNENYSIKNIRGLGYRLEIKND